VKKSKAQREQEREARREREEKARQRAIEVDNEHHVLALQEWCEINGISKATGRRILNSGDGPAVVQLSPRRVGVTVAANRQWQATRVRA
jgi:predicted DNA-binding transcriptional regulator AlpA